MVLLVRGREEDESHLSLSLPFCSLSLSLLYSSHQSAVLSHFLLLLSFIFLDSFRLPFPKKFSSYFSIDFEGKKERERESNLHLSTSHFDLLLSFNLEFILNYFTPISSLDYILYHLRFFHFNVSRYPLPPSSSPSSFLPSPSPSSSF